MRDNVCYAARNEGPEGSTSEPARHHAGVLAQIGEPAPPGDFSVAESDRPGGMIALAGAHEYECV